MPQQLWWGGGHQGIRWPKLLLDLGIRFGGHVALQLQSWQQEAVRSSVVLGGHAVRLPPGMLGRGSRVERSHITTCDARQSRGRVGAGILKGYLYDVSDRVVRVKSKQSVTSPLSSFPHACLCIFV